MKVVIFLALIIAYSNIFTTSKAHAKELMYSQDYASLEKKDSIRKLEQYIKYREIEILDYRNELEHTKESVIKEAVEERIKDLSQNVQYMKHVLKEVKEGKQATIEYKQ